VIDPIIPGLYPVYPGTVPIFDFTYLLNGELQNSPFQSVGTAPALEADEDFNQIRVYNPCDSFTPIAGPTNLAVLSDIVITRVRYGFVEDCVVVSLLTDENGQLVEFFP
jgi:hypothetical protein